MCPFARIGVGRDEEEGDTRNRDVFLGPSTVSGRRAASAAALAD
jgi:hypothetical protein